MKESEVHLKGWEAVGLSFGPLFLAWSCVEVSRRDVFIWNILLLVSAFLVSSGLIGLHRRMKVLSSEIEKLKSDHVEKDKIG